MLFRHTLAAFLWLGAVAHADFPRFEAEEIDPHAGEVVYAVTTADVNGDKKPDVIALNEDAAYWYENPTWKKHTIIKGKTERDNVCIQPHDIDGDGQIDFAIGAGWKPSDTNKASTLQWVSRDAKGEWQIHPIKYEQPTLHRMRFGSVLPGDTTQLVTVPLQGRGTKWPNWDAGAGSKVQVFTIPPDPTSPNWPSEVAENSLHTTHNLQLLKGEGLLHTDAILIAGWEGVFIISVRGKDENIWERKKLGVGNQDSTPFKGSSEVKRGMMADGAQDYIATIEPWHGTQVVVYFPTAYPPRDRVVLAEPVTWGHAVWCSDLDGDGDDELIIGQRDANKDASKGPKGPGIFVFDPHPSKKRGVPLEFTRHTIDDGGMACEDALAADLNGDGKPDIIAGGRATHNVKIYWNQGVKK